MSTRPSAPEHSSGPSESDSAFPTQSPLIPALTHPSIPSTRDPAPRTSPRQRQSVDSNHSVRAGVARATNINRQNGGFAVCLRLYEI